jgi:hypothetical protein
MNPCDMAVDYQPPRCEVVPTEHHLRATASLVIRHSFRLPVHVYDVVRVCRKDDPPALREVKRLTIAKTESPWPAKQATTFAGWIAAPFIRPDLSGLRPPEAAE